MIATLLVLGLLAGQVDVQVSPDVASGIYEPGATATWTIQVKNGAGKVAWVLRKGGLAEAGKGEAELVDGAARVSGTREDPGTLLLEVRYRPPGAAKDVVAHGAAAFAPDKIAPSAPPPDDFDAFWAEKVKALQAIPMNARLEAVDVGDPAVEYFKVTLDHVGGTKVRGQLARPKAAGTLPAILQVQWAGVYPLHRDWVLGHARAGWLAFNILAHDLPIDEAPEFYMAKAEKDLADYVMIGSESRETSYFLRMFLSCRRAVDYVTERPDWDGKALVVHGGSQGGYQAIVTAGLHPAVTAIAANVPAGCDHTGRRAGRAAGWPNYAGRAWMKDVEQRVEAARYFDAMNFARRVKCPALVGIGLVDTVCPAEGVFATVNLLQGPKKVIVMPRSGHGGEGPGHRDYYAVYGAFLNEQRR